MSQPNAEKQWQREQGITSTTMKLNEVTSPDTRLFAKSEFGPASNEWPALSFSSHKIATDFANIFRPSRDFVLYVGTGDPEKTENPAHRQRLMSILSVEPRAPISTRDLVPAESWQRTTRKWGVRWEWSLPIITAYDVSGFPRVHDAIPLTYRSLGNLPSLGRCIPVQEREYPVILALDLERIELHLSERARAVLSLNTDNRALRDEISRLVAMKKQDVAAAGRPTSGSTRCVSCRTTPTCSRC